MRKMLLTLLALACVACNEPELYMNQNSGPALGTSYAIIYPAGKALDYQREIDSVFNAINRSLSTYIPTSYISKINAGDSTLKVDHMFREVFTLSKQVYKDTEGYFDPTVGPLVNAWGFGPGEQREMSLPMIDSLLLYIGFDKVVLNDNGTVTKKYPEIYLDFNAVAKGYAIDRLAVLFNEKGLDNYLIEVGGEMVAKGTNTIRQKPWKVGIEDPQAIGQRASKRLINLQNKALASSGNYRKFRVDPNTGKKYVHTIDPKTGLTKNSNTLGVTVLANDCATADAFATAFMAMDLDKAFKLISKRSDLEAYIIYLDERGETQEYLTKGFQEITLPLSFSD